MKRLVCRYSLNELEQLIEGLPNANIMHGIMLKVINAYMEACNAPWFGCRRVDWYEIALMSVQQSYQVRTTLFDAGKLLYRSYSRPGFRHAIPIVVHTTLKDPPEPEPQNVYVYVPGMDRCNCNKGE